MLYIDMSEMQPWVTFTFEVHISFTYFVQFHLKLSIMQSKDLYFLLPEKYILVFYNDIL